MSVKLFVLPYKTGSAGSKELSNALEVPLLRREHSKFIPNSEKFVVNWGSSVNPLNSLTQYLNPPASVGRNSNKLKFFQDISLYNTNTMSQDDYIHIPKFAVDFETARSVWSTYTSIPWFARTILNGHSGAGIVELGSLGDWDSFEGTPCSLFTQYIKKGAEYRIHFSDFSSFNPSLPAIYFFAQRKGLKSGISPSPATHRIRNLANGYVYVNEGGHVPLPPSVIRLVHAFLKYNQASQFKLNFGALDIIYNKRYNTAYLLEVNTAPGLAGLTIEKYKEQFNLFKNTMNS